MKIFLSGGTGFIGSYVVKELSDQGHTVTVLARNPGKVPQLHTLPGVTIVEGSLGSYELIVKSMVEHEACIHIALGWGDDALNMLKNDTLPSVYLFEAAARLRLGCFIYTSSTAAIGDFPSLVNEQTPAKPVDYYGATKAASECFLHAISCQYPIKCTIVRPGYTFGNPVIEGASMQPDKRFHTIVGKAKKNEDIHVTRNDGTQFIWAGDLATVYSSLLHYDGKRKVYFGLGQKRILWEHIAQEAVRQCGSTSKIVLHENDRDADQSEIDVSPLREDLGLEFSAWEHIVDHIEYLLGMV